MTLIIEPMTWPEVVAFYNGLAYDSAWEIGPMLEMVESLAASPYAEHLYPATSMARLCLGRVRPLRFGYEMVIVEYVSTDPHFSFEYHEAANLPTPWTVKCEASAGLARLERILTRRLRWLNGSHFEAND
ncbi:MAG: hypothetical protein ACIAXF_07010 [Phycisphaerales bacterium JB063]